MSYTFWCSKCKFDHAGECPPDELANAKKKVRDITAEIEELMKALEGGYYNAAPTTLHQCKYDGSCGCGVKVDPDGTVTLSYTVQLQTPLTFIPIIFQIPESR